MIKEDCRINLVINVKNVFCTLVYENAIRIGMPSVLSLLVCSNQHL